MLLTLGFASAAVAVAMLACSQSSGPKQAHDNLIVDVPASTATSPPPPPPPSDAASDALTNDDYIENLDGYAPVVTCNACNCPSATSYCFGGSTGHIAFSGQCNWIDAGPGNDLQVGCHEVPDACSASDCECIIKAVAPTTGCYPVCAIVKGMAAVVYCPNP